MDNSGEWKNSHARAIPTSDLRTSSFIMAFSTSLGSSGFLTDHIPDRPEDSERNLASVLDAALELGMSDISYDHNRDSSQKKAAKTITNQHPRQMSNLNSGGSLKSAIRRITKENSKLRDEINGLSKIAKTRQDEDKVENMTGDKAKVSTKSISTMAQSAKKHDTIKWSDLVDKNGANALAKLGDGTSSESSCAMGFNRRMTQKKRRGVPRARSA